MFQCMDGGSCTFGNMMGCMGEQGVVYVEKYGFDHFLNPFREFANSYIFGKYTIRPEGWQCRFNRFRRVVDLTQACSYNIPVLGKR